MMFIRIKLSFEQSSGDVF